LSGGSKEIAPVGGGPVAACSPAFKAASVIQLPGIEEEAEEEAASADISAVLKG